MCLECKDKVSDKEIVHGMTLSCSISENQKSRSGPFYEIVIEDVSNCVKYAIGLTVSNFDGDIDDNIGGNHIRDFTHFRNKYIRNMRFKSGKN